MEYIYRTLNKIQTQLITWGKPFQSNKDVIICITGNPGVPDFYIEFGAELYESTGFPVCVIGHAGHVKVPDEESNNLYDQEHLFNLKGQVEHKLDFIRNHVDKNCKIHLIGHSIGAWLILEMMQEDELLSSRVASVNLLFPTLQRMAESRNGKVLNGFLRKIHYVLIILFTLVYFLPTFLTIYFINIYLWFNSLPSNYTERIQKYLDPKVGEKVLFLAFDEMDTVIKLNTNMIEKVKGLTNVIYSNRDGWAPLSYMKDLEKYYPDIQLKQVSIDHAFVLKSSEEVAGMVSDFIKTKVQ